MQKDWEFTRTKSLTSLRHKTKHNSNIVYDERFRVKRKYQGKRSS